MPADFHRACLLILFGYGLDTDRTHPTLVADLLGVTRGDDGLGTAYAKRLDRTGEQRLWQHPVAHAAALAEANLDRAATGRTWGYRPGLTTYWLDLLTALGHERSEVEQAVYDEAAAADDADDLDDEDYDDEDAAVNDDDTHDAQPDHGTAD